MSALTITRGLPGSGKTTWAKQWVAEAPAARVRVNRDDLRDMLFGRRTDLAYEQEALVTAVSHAAVKAALKDGLHVVADDTNLRPRYVRQWQSVATECGVDFHVHEMPASVDTAVLQDSRRASPVGEAVIYALAQKYVPKGQYLPVKDAPPPPAGPAPYERGRGGKAIIVDVDGTVALMGDRSPYDWSRVEEDGPNYAVIEVVEKMSEDHVVLFVSGRDASCRAATFRWISNHIYLSGDWDLLMRAEGDQRPDAIVKAEIFDQFIRDEFDVCAVFDDRNSVVAMWRSMGITCLQVAEGDF